MPGRRQHEPAEHDRQPPAAAALEPIGRGAAPRHEQEQQHVVDRHDHADGGAVVAERVAHQRRHEGAEERPGDAGEEAAQADDRACQIRGSRGVSRRIDHGARCRGRRVGRSFDGHRSVKRDREGRY